MTGLAILLFFTSLASKNSYGNLGENVTMSVRQLLYEKILRKNIGWFDHRDNGVSVLTSAMAQDTSIINGVSTESLGPQIEGAAAFLLGIAVGFFYSWKVSLVVLLVSPIMAIGNAMQMQFTKGLTESTNDLIKDANLLCGDTISNFRTIQSFGNANLLVEEFK